MFTLVRKDFEGYAKNLDTAMKYESYSKRGSVTTAKENWFAIAEI